MSHQKSIKNMKDQNGIAPSNSIPTKMFTNENYLNRPQDKGLKRIIIDFIKYF